VHENELYCTTNVKEDLAQLHGISRKIGYSPMD